MLETNINAGKDQQLSVYYLLFIHLYGYEIHLLVRNSWNVNLRNMFNDGYAYSSIRNKFLKCFLD